MIGPKHRWRDSRCRISRACFLILGGMAELFLLCILLPNSIDGSAAPAQSLPVGGSLLLDDFEDVTDWSGMKLERTIVHSGTASGRWDNHFSTKSIRKNFSPALDFSARDQIQIWIYSGTANQAQIELILDSDNPADPAGWDYFRYSFTVDWTGWRSFRIPFSSFTLARTPRGWNHINYIQFSADGWDHTPRADTLLIFDDLSIESGCITDVKWTTAYSPERFSYLYTLRLSERTGFQRTLALQVDNPAGSPFLIDLPTPTVTLPPNGLTSVLVRIHMPLSTLYYQKALALHHVGVAIREKATVVDETILPAAVPLFYPPQSYPRTLLNNSDLSRIKKWKVSQPWAAEAQTGIIQAADAWPQKYQQTFYLTDWSLPPEGGQWGMWYICPGSSVYLRYEGSQRHVCPTDNKVYSGWPYEQVIYARMHDALAEAARDQGLAYRLSGDGRYAQAAAEILRRYADRYLTFPYHDVNNKSGRSGGRVHAQTLDESIWLVSMAWAYDLIADSPALSPSDCIHIEQDLLRAAATTIQRNPAGISNWQSWHNAGVGAVGFALYDPVLMASALDDPRNGFFFQMKNSVDSDGFWYEGSWGYHFYALTAHRYLAEMAARSGGLDLYSHPSMQGMFQSPVLFALPDGSLPQFNDSGAINLTTRDTLYESAYLRYGDTSYLSILGRRTRGREALLWGVEVLPAPLEITLPSLIFPDAGYAVLRTNGGNDPLCLALDFGPHGGGHGHYDKLGLVLFARGMIMGIDPGTQSYAAPTHETWDKQTIAHNTVVVNTQSQGQATGTLHRFASLPGLAMVSADAGSAYPSTPLRRTMALTPEYAVDRFRLQSLDGKEQDFDWIYHNAGLPHTSLSLSPYNLLPSQNGYQHLSRISASSTSADWEVSFDSATLPGTPYGSVYTNPSSISASFTFQEGIAFQGKWAGRMTYDFSAAGGYILFSTPQPPLIPQVPQKLQVALQGDGSGNSLTLRVNDTTDERFSCPMGIINWTGWKVLTTPEIGSCSHFLGNNDGIFDTPVKQIAIQLDHQSGHLVVGTLYVDDIRLSYPQAGIQPVESFEVEPRGLRLRMLGETGTTVVLGEGLGPDIKKPIPFALARRRAQETTFLSLMQPIDATASDTSFSLLPTNAGRSDEAGAYQISAARYTDRLLAVASGSGFTWRTFGNSGCDGELCLLRWDSDQRLVRLILVEGTKMMDSGISLLDSPGKVPGMQVDYQETVLRIRTTAPLQPMLRLWGPGVTGVYVNDSPKAFTREKDYVLLSNTSRKTRR